jgi:hypothetical protein
MKHLRGNKVWVGIAASYFVHKINQAIFFRNFQIRAVTIQ